MKIEELEKVIALFEKANISSLEVEDGGIKIKLTKEMKAVEVVSTIKTDNVSSVQTKQQEEKKEIVEDQGEYVHSPLVGTYHQAPFQDAKPFVEVGTVVKKGDKLCIIEAMKVMNEITAPKDGKILKIMATEGSMVEFDQPLFLIGD